MKNRCSILRRSIRPGLFLLVLTAGSAGAVTHLEQVERLGAVYGALLDFRSLAVPGPRAPGLMELALELEPVPEIDNRIGAKREPVDAFPLVGRGRLHWSPFAALRLGGYAIPPVEVRGSTARLWGIDAAYGWAVRDRVFSARLYHTQGTVSGAFSAPDVADEFRLQASGGDLRAGRVFGSWTLYGGVGGGRNRTRFTMDADDAMIAHRRRYLFGFAGAGWTQGPWTAVAELHRTPSYLTNTMMSLSYGF